MRRRLALFVVLLSVAMLSSGVARADQEKTVQWNDAWPRVRAIELVNIVALTAGSVLVHNTPASDHAKWNGPILFDNEARELFQLHTKRGQRVAGHMSDIIGRGMVLAPYVVDAYIVALGVHQNADVALQMTLINMQSLGLTGVVSLGTEHWVGRARPYYRDCPPADPTNPERETPIGFSSCGGSDDFQSFFSGHMSGATTMAGLTCVHHQHLPLYGGGLSDAMACAVMISLSAMVGASRLMVDRHWASDVIAGAGVGVLSGYVLPLWLHYGFGSRKRTQLPTSIQTAWGVVAPIPQVYPGGAGVSLALF